MYFTINITPKNVDNKTYNITIVIHNNYHGYNSSRNTTC